MKESYAKGLVDNCPDALGISAILTVGVDRRKYGLRNSWWWGLITEQA